MNDQVRIVVAVAIAALFASIGIACARAQYPWLVFACIVVGGLCMLGLLAPNNNK